MVKSNSLNLSHKNEKNEDDNPTLFINIGDYSKRMSWAQVEVLRRLLEHILEEKIENATVSTGTTANTIPSNIPEISKNESDNNKMEMYAEVIAGDKVKQVNGEIIGFTDKALLIKLSEGVGVWIPKFTVKFLLLNNLRLSMKSESLNQFSIITRYLSPNFPNSLSISVL